MYMYICKYRSINLHIIYLSTCVGEVFEKSYLGNVTSMQMNSYYTAALYDGKIHLHVVHIFTFAHTCIYIYMYNQSFLLG